MFFRIVVVFHVKKHAQLKNLFHLPNRSLILLILHGFVFSGFYSPILPVFLFFACFFSSLEFLMWPF